MRPALLLLALVAVVASLLPPRYAGEYDLAGFSQLPTLVNGRIKPLDTVARTTLMVLQGRQRVTAPNGRTVSPAEWLLEVLYRPEVANAYPTFEIVHPDVLALLNLTPGDGAGEKRFTYLQIQKGVEELARQSKLADAVETPLRTPFQRAVIQLRDNVVLYQSLQDSLVPPGADNFLGTWPVPWHHDVDSPTSKAFVAAFMKRHGKPPENQAWGDYLVLKIMAQAMNENKTTDSMKLIDYFEKGAQFDLLKTRKGYFRSWDHQLMQQMYTLTPKKKGEARDKWDFLQLGPAVPNADEPLDIIAPTREENSCNL